eukprot:39035-Rhodomonas_salina.1
MPACSEKSENSKKGGSLPAAPHGHRHTLLLSAVCSCLLSTAVCCWCTLPTQQQHKTTETVI